MNSFSFLLGGLYAVQSERSVHNGRSGIQFLVHPGRTGICSPGPHSQSQHAQAQSHSAHLRGIPLHHSFILHVLDIHEDEAAVSSTAVLNYTLYLSLLACTFLSSPLLSAFKIWMHTYIQQQYNNIWNSSTREVKSQSDKTWLRSGVKLIVFGITKDEGRFRYCPNNSVVRKKFSTLYI